MPRVKIGLSMLYCLGEPFNKMIKRLNKVETDYVEVVDDGLHALDKGRVQTLKDIGKSRGIKYTLHAPFADINIASPSKPMLNAALKRLKQSLAYANALDAKLWVFHPGLQSAISPFYPGLDWKNNVESIKQLYMTAENYGVNTALENLPLKYGFTMKTPDDFAKFYRETGLNIGIVLDTGHANLEGQIEPFLKRLPDKIVHVHASDNVGDLDLHLGIGYGKINWEQFARDLKGIGYDGIVMVESVEHVEESLQKLKKLLV